MRPLSLPALPVLLASFFLSACVSQPVIPEDTRYQATATAVPVDDHWQPQAVDDGVDNVWDRLLDNFSLQLDIDNPRLKLQRDWFIKHPTYINRVSQRAEPYIYYIAEQIEVRNMPGEVALLPIVESAFDPFAYSHGRASGVWQFIPSTGTYFGLKQDWWYDGRRDIRAATNAALDYLSNLANRFDGDWHLALAAYNSGGGTVSRAIRRNKEAGKPTDFWSLDLPKETKAYVPKLLALAQLLKYPEKYNIPFTPIDNTPFFAVVETGGQIDLAQIADMSDTDLEQIYRLNPGFNRWATHPDGPHQILVPVDKRHQLQQALVDLPPAKRLQWHRYTVKSGDNLQSIGRTYRTTIEVIKQANNLTGSTIRVGQTLLIPGALKNQEAYSQSLSQRLDRTRNQRQPGNTRKIAYTVRAGDSFWKIGRQYNVTSRDIAHWNGMAPGDPLRVGQQLTVWVPQDSKAPSRSAREEIRKVTYRVRSGDSLASIASRFRVTIADIRKWNPNDTRNKYLYPGQKLLLHVNVVH
ncbi:LysM peptidoglycan-binding domain-containing protein [Oceanobacter sp. 4_MG-2023]|uniref:lytic transglycosylase n=2 Tax=Gammaproteobacteria TaxID=1236 RepID=UPI0027352BD4|nr:LysM peptidoglycan-binding domain-containing protein [Oceanobacter sp. 4_MG-2023]MDP2546763.1 LysM peptidoglycan-binding domain-containing protein [Oceanobacter sp. 4_MG-2023]